MFGTPVQIKDNMAVFHSEWTYAIKALDSWNKLWWACDGSPRSGQARILDETYANCVNQTSSRLFFAVTVAENLIIVDAAISNAFAEAPPPKQGFYIHPDSKAFRDWWVMHKRRPLISAGEVIPIYPLCRGIRNHLDYGKNMRTQFYVNVALCRQYMNRACTPVLWTANGWFSNVRLTTLPWTLLSSISPTCRLPTPPHPTYVLSGVQVHCWEVHKSTCWFGYICSFFIYNTHDCYRCTCVRTTLGRFHHQSLVGYSLAWLVQSYMSLHIRLWGGVLP